MGLLKLAIRGGIVTDETVTSQEGRWVDGNLVRFIDGLPQPVGGWKLFDIDGASFWGMARKLREWVDNDGVKYIALGTNIRLYVVTGGTLHNITPIEDSGSLPADPVATVSGSSIVTITENAHGRIPGSVVALDNLTVVNGITVDGAYVVQTVPTANTYTIETLQTASGTGSGGGAGGTFEYELNPGAESSSFGLGYGTGPYGEGTWGTPRTAGGVQLNARTWSLDTYGEDLQGSYRPGGSFYRWQRNTALRATIVPNASTNLIGHIITPERIAMLFGGGGDKLLVEWSDQEDIEEYAPSATNQAGDFLLSGGNEIMGAIQARSGLTIVFTDTDAFTVQYLGDQAVYGFQRIGTNCGLIGPNAAAEVAGAVYWMSNDDFYVYDGGGARQLPSADIRQFLFGTVNRVQKDKIHCGYNSRFNELWWWYCSAAEDEIDRYVAVSLTTGEWTIGIMSRTAWMTGLLIGFPLAATTRGVLMQHEDGRNNNDAFVLDNPLFAIAGNTLAVLVAPAHGGQPGDQLEIYNADSLGGVEFDGVHEISSVPDADRIVFHNSNGEAASDAGPGGGLEVVIVIRKPLNPSIETGEMDIGDGDMLMDIFGLIPDFKDLTGDLLLFLLTRDYPFASRESEALTITSSSGRIEARSSGRQLAIRITQTGVIDGFWRLGACRIDLQSAGKRR